MNAQDLKDLRAEFDKFVEDRCTFDAEGNVVENKEGEEDEEGIPQFVDVLNAKLLSPAISGVYLSRLDIKRVAEAIDESIPIKERARMIKTLFRHTTSKDYLKQAFGEINKHINGRVLIYQELGEAFPSSSSVFDDYIAKAKKMQKTLDKIIEDFEEIEPTDDPMLI